MQNAATRSPSARPQPGGALRTVPPTSLPGTNGRSGLIWYSPRVCSTSGNDTPAAWTSTMTPAPGVSRCDGSGSDTSTSDSAEAGPVSSVIWIARIGAGGRYRRDEGAGEHGDLAAQLGPCAVERGDDVVAGLHRHLRREQHLARAEVYGLEVVDARDPVHPGQAVA